MDKEIEDALCMLLHCSLKDTEYETQVEQYKIVRKYITNLQEENKKQKEVIDKIKHILNNQMNYREFVDIVNDIEDILKEVSE